MLHCYLEFQKIFNRVGPSELIRNILNLIITIFSSDYHPVVFIRHLTKDAVIFLLKLENDHMNLNTAEMFKTR